MSLKIKLDDSQMWVPPVDSSGYSIPWSSSDLSAVDGTYDMGGTISLSLHPDLLKIMNSLKVGDLVSDHKGRIGIVVREVEIEPTKTITISGVKSFVVSFSGKEEMCFSFTLSKMEKEDE